MRISVYDDMRAALDSALAACAASERRELELTAQLADANALLGETKTLLHRVHGFQIVGMSGERALGLERDIKAIFPALHDHLSAQPAASVILELRAINGNLAKLVREAGGSLDARGEYKPEEEKHA